MTCTSEVMSLTWWQALDIRQGWMKLPVDAMKDAGPAAQTLGGLLDVTSRETFLVASGIAQHACLPTKTVRNHLGLLHNLGWIENAGRLRTRAGVPRRTCTIRITAKSKAAANRYVALPWWACDSNQFNWSSKAVLAVITSRMLGLKAAAEKDHAGDDIEGAVEILGGPDRFAFSLSYLVAQTGLNREAVVAAKRNLAHVGVITWNPGDSNRDADLLIPRDDFLIEVNLVRHSEESNFSRSFLSKKGSRILGTMSGRILGNR